MKDTILQELSILQTTCASEPAGIHKARQYSTAIKTIRNLPCVKTMADIPVGKGTGIGEKITQKIEEILATGHLAAADRARQTKAPDTLDLFRNIYGVGPKKAAALVESGYRTLAELRAAAEEDESILTKNMQVGLRHYDDFLERIPRSEMEDHERILLQGNAMSMKGIILSGSYRRGHPDSGDIDMLFSPVGPTSSLKPFVAYLKSRKYITDVLAQGDTKCMAVCRIPGKPFRRLDLVMTPEDEYPFALLYFTGCDRFNIRMRQVAIERGYSLNEHSLTHMATKTMVRGLRTEEDIFRFLGLVYKKPEERTGSDAVVYG